MRIALISDIHGNVDALTAVLDDIASAGCDDVRCLGDVVGYGGDPEACVNLVRESVSICLLGNHDAVAVGDHSDVQFNRIAREAIRRTRELLSEESIAYLRTLPYSQDSGELLLVHSSPVEPRHWSYVFIGDPLSEIFEESTARVIGIGHTHTPGVGNDRDGLLLFFGEGRIRLENGMRYVVNVGSVGQPRDRDARAAWAVLDLEEGTYEARRVIYDIEAAQRRIVASGLDRSLAERLAWGV